MLPGMFHRDEGLSDKVSGQPPVFGFFRGSVGLGFLANELPVLEHLLDNKAEQIMSFSTRRRSAAPDDGCCCHQDR